MIRKIGNRLLMKNRKSKLQRIGKFYFEREEC